MVKAVWKGVVIAESGDTVVVEGNHYFPEASLKREYVSFLSTPLSIQTCGRDGNP